MAAKRHSHYDVKNVEIDENKISFFDDEIEDMFEKQEIKKKNKKNYSKNTKRIMRN